MLTLKSNFGQQFSHLNFKDLNKLVLGDHYENPHLCAACELGKQSRKSHSSIVSTKIIAPLELLHIDLCGPSSIESLAGNKYILVIVHYNKMGLIQHPKSAVIGLKSVINQTIGKIDSPMLTRLLTFSKLGAADHAIVLILKILNDRELMEATYHAILTSEIRRTNAFGNLGRRVCRRWHDWKPLEIRTAVENGRLETRRPTLEAYEVTMELNLRTKFLMTFSETKLHTHHLKMELLNIATGHFAILLEINSMRK
ncbi:hypothetical protein LXL04_024505 [Taraxacum kok-saghyz]